MKSLAMFVVCLLSLTFNLAFQLAEGLSTTKHKCKAPDFVMTGIKVNGTHVAPLAQHEYQTKNPLSLTFGILDWPVMEFEFEKTQPFSSPYECVGSTFLQLKEQINGYDTLKLILFNCTSMGCEQKLYPSFFMERIESFMDLNEINESRMDVDISCEEKKKDLKAMKKKFSWKFSIHISVPNSVPLLPSAALENIRGKKTVSKDNVVSRYAVFEFPDEATKASLIFGSQVESLDKTTGNFQMGPIYLRLAEYDIDVPEGAEDEEERDNLNT